MLKREVLSSWNTGVSAAADVEGPSAALNMSVDHTEASSTPRAWNSVFTTVLDRAIPRKRDGCAVMNNAPASQSPIIGQYAYNYRDPDTRNVTQYYLLVREDGSIYWMDEDGTETLIEADTFTPGFFPPSFATLNNQAFIANGNERVKVYGEEIQNFGIDRPDASAMVANAGVIGKLNGVYELALTYYNSVSGHESSRSDAVGSVTANFQKIDLTNVPVPSDPQVTTVLVYIRNTDTQNEFYRVGEIVAGITTGTVDVDTADEDLIIQGPDTEENDAPPESIKYLCAHKSRMFAADDGKLYWSKTAFPESFDPDAFDYVNQNDGQKITGLASIPGGLLIIFKEDSYYVLEGDVPTIWTIAKLGPEVGCLAAPSIVLGADALYWWSEQGPVKMAFSQLNTPELIGYNRISGVISRRKLNYAQRQRICGTFNITGQRVLWSVPEASNQRNTKLVSWSSRLGCWESDRWDPIDAASLGVQNNRSSEPFVMLGGYKGQVFKLGVGQVDGVPEGDTTGTFVAFGATIATLTVLSVVHSATTQINVHASDWTVVSGDVGRWVHITGGTATHGYYRITAVDVGANRWTLDRSAGTVGQTVVGITSAPTASISAITDAGADFHISGSGLVERKVTILTSTMVPITTGVRPHVTANTGTALTLDRAVSNLLTGSTYTYVVGGIDWQFDTSWRDADSAFEKKRLLFVFTMALLYGAEMYVDILTNRRSLTMESDRFATIGSDAALWESFDWNDGTLWNDAEITYDRTRGGRTGVTFALRYRNPFAFEPMVLLRAGMEVDVVDTKLG